MLKFQLASCCAILIVGLVGAILSFNKGAWQLSISIALLIPVLSAGIIFGIGVCQRSVIVMLLSFTSVLFGASSVLYSHDGFDIKLANAHSDLLTAYVEISHTCKPQNREIYYLIEDGIKSCSQQTYESLGNAGVELHKSLRLPPPASFVDSISSSIEGRIIDKCTKSYLKIEPECNINSYISKESQEVLKAKK